MHAEVAARCRAALIDAEAAFRAGNQADLLMALVSSDRCPCAADLGILPTQQADVCVQVLVCRWIAAAAWWRCCRPGARDPRNISCPPLPPPLRLQVKMAGALQTFPLPAGSAEAELVAAGVVKQTSLLFRKAIFLEIGAQGGGTCEE